MAGNISQPQSMAISGTLWITGRKAYMTGLGSQSQFMNISVTTTNSKNFKREK